jgi:hypothetical protein
MQQGEEGANKEVVSLDTLSQLTGFPSSLIKEELFDGQELDGEKVDIEGLRSALIKYIDSTMIVDNQ